VKLAVFPATDLETALSLWLNISGLQIIGSILKYFTTAGQKLLLYSYLHLCFSYALYQYNTVLSLHFFSCYL